MWRRDRRQRFVYTCLYNSPWHESAKLFRNWSQTLYEDRSKEVCNFLKRLKSVLRVLRQAWDANTYRQGALASMLSDLCVSLFFLHCRFLDLALRAGAQHARTRACALHCMRPKVDAVPEDNSKRGATF